MRIRFGILLSVLFLAGTLKSHAATDQPLWPVLGVSTNLAYDITYIPNYGLTSIPNVSLELYPAQAPHYSVGLDVEWPMWKHYDTHRFMQVHNVTVWGRRYFKPRDNRRRGWYVLAGGNLGNFGIGASDKVAILSENMPHWSIAFFSITAYSIWNITIIKRINKTILRMF